MQTITWSPQLIHAVRELKKLDIHKIARVLNERKFMNSFALSYEEEQTVKSIITQRSNSLTVESWWV